MDQFAQNFFASQNSELRSYMLEKNSADIFRGMLDCLEDGVVAIDQTARIFYTNPAYSKIIGVPGRAVLGRNMHELEPEAAILKVLASGIPIQKTVLIKSINRYVKVNIYPLKRLDELAGAVSFFHDVSQEYHMQQELRLAQNLAEHFRQQWKNNSLWGGNDMIGSSHALKQTQAMASLVAPTDATVLLLGEHGVGKEVLARNIHYASARHQKSFIAVNCAALPESLLESELFGYEDGAFTGAKKGGQLGKFELANGGTLFLDEIGDLPLSMQVKLLRAIQEKEIEKIGRSGVISIDVRIIAATNRNLQELVELGRFRDDLFYRLNVVSITLPPLRERSEDISLLSDYFLQKYQDKYNKQLQISPACKAILLKHKWPGNVRELQNCLEYACIMCQDGHVLPEHIPSHILEKTDYVPADTIPVNLDWQEAISALECSLLQEALKKCHGNRSQAIRKLRLGRRTFYRKMKQYNLL
jgi:PAS domain S-box-containing protein